MRLFLIGWALLLVLGAAGLLARSSDHASSANAAVVARQPSQQEFAQELERFFLRNGITIDVNAIESDRAGYATPYLHFFGYMSKAMIFQLLENGKLLQTAKKIGFRGVDFQSKVDGHYFFDLTGDGPIPHCAQHDRVCW